MFLVLREHKVPTLIMITVSILSTQDKDLTTLSEMSVSHVRVHALHVSKVMQVKKVKVKSAFRPS